MARNMCPWQHFCFILSKRILGTKMYGEGCVGLLSSLPPTPLWTFFNTGRKHGFTERQRRSQGYQHIWQRPWNSKALMHLTLSLTPIKGEVKTIFDFTFRWASKVHSKSNFSTRVKSHYYYYCCCLKVHEFICGLPCSLSVKRQGRFSSQCPVERHIKNWNSW